MTHPIHTSDLRRPRILLYSHDSYGLGHFRRSMNLAQGLVEAFPSASVLVASGSPCATQFVLPPRVDVIKLPAVGKSTEGEYVSRSLPESLDFVLDLRRQLLLATFRSFAPHLLLVDQKVIGLGGELIDVLAEARRTGTRTILGVRDIIDDPAVVAREWGSPKVVHALTESYDRICIYGSPAVFDARVEYPVPPELSDRLEYCGYVVAPPPRATRPIPSLRPQVLVTMGGGEDGSDRVETYLDAISAEHVGWNTMLVLGPLMERAVVRRIKRRVRALGNVTAHAFRADLLRLLAESDAVVSMAGYNTVAEILQSGVPAVLMPRCYPRTEQKIRAERLDGLGLATCLLDPDPAALRSAVEQAIASPRTRHHALPLDGCLRVCAIVRELLTPVPSSASLTVSA